MLSARAMLSRCPAAPTYQRREPEHTVLYQTVQAHLATFLGQMAEDAESAALPAFVKREFKAYLRCGVLRHGLLHLRCDTCGDDTVVAFSCKSRGTRLGRAQGTAGGIEEACRPSRGGEEASGEEVGTAPVKEMVRGRTGGSLDQSDPETA